MTTRLKYVAGGLLVVSLALSGTASTFAAGSHAKSRVRTTAKPATARVVSGTFIDVMHGRKAPDSTTLSIRGKKGKTLTYDVTAKTRYDVKGKITAAAPRLRTGELIQVRHPVSKGTDQDTALLITVP